MIRSCPVAAVFGLQQLLERQLHALMQGQVLSQHSSLEQAAGSQPQQQPGLAQHQYLVAAHQQLRLPGAFKRCTGLLPRLGLHAAGISNNTSSCPVVAGSWQLQRQYARPCSEAVEDELAAAASPSCRRRSRTTTSSDPAADAPAAVEAAAAAAAAMDAASKEDTTPEPAAASSRRRGTTESRALLRRTTVGRMRDAVPMMITCSGLPQLLPFQHLQHAGLLQLVPPGIACRALLLLQLQIKCTFCSSVLQESRAAIEDVAVMSKSQLMRRNKVCAVLAFQLYC